MENATATAPPDVQQQLHDINEKLDYLTAQIQRWDRQQRVREELQEDLVRIGREAFQAMVVELDEVAAHFDSKDLLALVKTLLRNVDTLSGAVQQMQSAADLLQDVRPLTKEMFDHLLERLEQMDRMGYFEFMRELSGVLDEVVTAFGPDDVRLLRENVVSILLTVKNLTQPEMLATMDNFVHFYRTMEVPAREDATYRQLLVELRKPETKRGLAFLLQFLQRLSSPDGAAVAPAPHTPLDYQAQED